MARRRQTIRRLAGACVTGNLVAPALHTPRLLLRPHRAEDLDACAAMWANPIVTLHITNRASERQETWMRMLRYAGLWSMLGYGYWAVEERASSTFVGDVGFADFHRELNPPIEGIPEAGWALDPAFYGRGFATEALRAALAWADANVPAPKTVCIIAPENAASIRVAEKAGYTERTAATFRGDPAVLLMRARVTV
jgi:RimJ/RimL family protein N-acetyltransferase